MLPYQNIFRLLANQKTLTKLYKPRANRLQPGLYGMLFYRPSACLNFDHGQGPRDKFLSNNYGSEVVFHISRILSFTVMKNLIEQSQGTIDIPWNPGYKPWTYTTS